MSGDVRVVLVTAPDVESGERLGTALVRERLAACVNVVPGVTSIYWWEGRLERASEVLLVLKTTGGTVAALRERAVALHPYEVPEVLVLDVKEGHEPYLDWVRRESGRSGEGGGS